MLAHVGAKYILQLLRVRHLHELRQKFWNWIETNIHLQLSARTATHLSPQHTHTVPRQQIFLLVFNEWWESNQSFESAQDAFWTALHEPCQVSGEPNKSTHKEERDHGGNVCEQKWDNHSCLLSTLAKSKQTLFYFQLLLSHMVTGRNCYHFILCRMFQKLETSHTFPMWMLSIFKQPLSVWIQNWIYSTAP